VETNIIGVIGAGAMGSGIAQVAATAGNAVLIYDSSETALEKAKLALKSSLLRAVEKQKMSEAEGDAVLKRIGFVSGLSPLKDCMLVIEAIVEKLEIKQQVFGELEKNVSADCILASNTSSLSITSIASACKRPERVIGLHFFNPAPIMPLVEIIPGLGTRVQVQMESKKIIESWNKVCILAKDTPGFVVNRVARSFYGEAIRIYEEGLAGAEGEEGFATIDWAMKEFGGFKMGPFELMDFIGNDINYMVTETVWTQLFFDPRYKPSLTQKRLFEAGRFGRKCGQGYYSYLEGALKAQPRKDVQLGKAICSRVLIMLMNEAADALYYKVASRDDIDLAMTLGVNYPKGLLKWADETCLEKVVERIEGLYDEYGEDRYRPSVLLKRMAKDKLKFF
jgi:3-hydroxybutyryl-CoA dehydrogenase